MLKLDEKRADILLRALAREHLSLREEGIRNDDIKDLMRDIVRAAYGVECGPVSSIFRRGSPPDPIVKPPPVERPDPSKKRLVLDPNTGYMMYRR